MARAARVPGGRPVVVGVRFTVEEIARIDAARGALDRATYVREVFFRGETAQK